MTTSLSLPPGQRAGRGEAANDAGDLLMTRAELYALTDYRQPAAQLAELHRQGYWRARRAPVTGRVILERAHYEAVARGDDTQPATSSGRAPQLRPA